MPLQYFALDSTHGDFAAAIAALPTASAQYLSYTPTLVQRAAAHDADIKIVAGVVEEADLTGGLAGLAASAYPNELCRHRWTTLAGLRQSGFHMVGESERSWEAVAGRTAVHIRPQIGTTGGNPQVPGGGGYGGGDGLTDFDAANGPIDRAALGGGSSHLYETGKSYFYKGAHVRRGHTGAGGNSPFGNGVPQNGQLAVEDPTGLGDAGKINFYYGGDSSPLGPGMFWGTYVIYDKNSSLPWEEFGAGSGIWVNGQFQGSAAGNSIGTTGVVQDADIEDITIDADTLTKQHHLVGQGTTLSNLDGSTGRGRYYAQTSFGIGEAAWDAVLFNDGAGNWTDLTAAANDATADDFEMMPAGAADGAYIAFIRTGEFPGCMLLNMSQAQVGGTIVPGYSLGSGDVTGTFTNIIDPSNGLTVNTFSEIAFNPKADWASDTFAAGEAFETTGYAFVFRKTGGTVTTAARGDQSLRRAKAVFVHRWNDATPILGPCMRPGGAAGLRHTLSGKTNFEYINPRIGTIGIWGNEGLRGAAGFIWTGGQILPYGDLQLGTNNLAATFRASQTDKGQAVWWSIADKRVQDKTNPLIQDILAEVQNLADLYGVDEDVTADMDALGVNPADYLTAADDLPEWSDIVYCINGLYPGVNGGRWNPVICDGITTRKVGMRHDTLNDTEVIDLYVNEDPTDHHSFAMRGDDDADGYLLDRMGFEDFLRAVETYAPATGGLNRPVSGAASGCRNYRFRFGYHHTHNGMVDGSQPAAAFVFSGDNDRGLYDDGSGANDGNQVLFWGMKDINNETNVAGSGIGYGDEEILTARGLVFDGCRWALSTNRAHGPISANAITFDGDSTFNDITSTVMVTGGSATPLFAAGAAGNILHLGVVHKINRRYGFTITTAGVGAPTLAWEEWTGSAWQAVSNLSDGTNGLTQSGAATFDRPAALPLLEIGPKTIRPVRVRIVSGSFSTVPQASKIESWHVGGSIDIQHYTVKNIIKGIHRVIGTTFSFNSSTLIDDHATIILNEGQSADDSFYKFGSSSTDTPDENLATFQARSKAALTSAAERDSIFGPNSTTE